MVTVGADPVRVESRLAAGEIGCPTCRDGVLGAGGMPGPAHGRELSMSSNGPGPS
jgi:hypothetical protein